MLMVVGLLEGCWIVRLLPFLQGNMPELLFSLYVLVIYD
jgi:hypothetical protein